MDKADYIKWSEFRQNKSINITDGEQHLICELHSKYFNHPYYKPCTCNPHEYNRWIGDLNTMHDQFEN